MKRALVLAVALACRSDPPARQVAQPPPPRDAADPYAAARDKLVDDTMVKRDITDPRVIAAMRRVPRQEFVPDDQRAHAYEDHPLAIGNGQTISQPHIVAAMTQAAHVQPGARVLEIGTGSGYQTAVLCELGADVYSIEIVEPLARKSQALLARLGYKAHTRIGDGYRGWPEAAPFGAIIVTAAPAAVPQPLVDQLAVGGRLVIPVGTDDQQLRVITRGPTGATSETLMPVRFVPMTGEAVSGAARSGSASR
ncbi:MAG TPA: protein-L-isoaspartate(D-aspartate) O-methyltransferase [Kofleriaceae bacterium]|nr:protein-L-isoaspartate(D-aspartate) O-methyltransferase [Kofleriaceae bacterium]